MTRRTPPVRATIVLTILLAGCGLMARVPGDDVPRGWRRPEPDETAQAWRDGSQHRYLRLRADFTGDGLEDEAAFLVETPAVRLVLVLLEARKETSAPTIHLIDDLGEVGLLEYAGIDVASPGIHRVMCEKVSKKACPAKDRKRPLDVRTPAIDYFKPECARRLFYWNPTTQQLDQAWTSD